MRKEPKPSPPMRGRGQGEGGAGATATIVSPVLNASALHTHERSDAAAKRLRRDATFTEKRLWRELRNLRAEAGLHFRRQAPIGPYVVDFVCHAAKLVIEVDGGVHVLKVEQDAARDAWLEGRGYRVMRFGNGVVAENVEWVVAGILAAVGAGTPTPGPSPQGGGGHV